MYAAPTGCPGTVARAHGSLIVTSASAMGANPARIEARNRFFIVSELKSCVFSPSRVGPSSMTKRERTSSQHRRNGGARLEATLLPSGTPGWQHRLRESGIVRWSARLRGRPHEQWTGRLVEQEWVRMRHVRNEYEGSIRRDRPYGICMHSAEWAVLGVLVVLPGRKRLGALPCHLDLLDAGRRANLRPLFGRRLFCGQRMRNRWRERDQQNGKARHPCRHDSCYPVHSHAGILSESSRRPRAFPRRPRESEPAAVRTGVEHLIQLECP